MQIISKKKKSFAIIVIILSVAIFLCVILYIHKDLNKSETLMHYEQEGIITGVRWNSAWGAQMLHSITISNDNSEYMHVVIRIYIQKDTVIKDMQGNQREFSALHEGQMIRATVLNQVSYGGIWVDPETGENIPEEGIHGCSEILILDEGI